jgi:4-amino-4-deoxy-L-arabinose transferase-like glycosyltransferase
MPAQSATLTWRDLTFPAVVALIARATVVLFLAVNEPGGLQPGLFRTADSARYLELSDSLLAGSFATSAGPEVYRLPVYPLFLIPAVASGFPTLGTIVLQTLACAVLAALVCVTAAQAGLGRRSAMAAGMLCAFEPTLLMWSLQVMAEAPLALAVSGATLALVQWSRTARLPYCFVGMLCGSVAALTKPAAILIPLTLALLAPFLVTGRSARWRLCVGVAALVTAIAPIAGWVLRNSMSTGNATYSTQVAHFGRSSAFNEWRTANPNVSQAQLDEERKRFQLKMPTSTLGAAPLSVTRLVLHTRGILNTVISPGGLTWAQFLGVEPRRFETSRQLVRGGRWSFFADAWTSRPTVALMSVGLGAVTLGYWLLFGAGVVLGRGRNPALVKLTLAITLALLATAGGPWAQSRFRAPFVSVWCLMAGLGWVTRREHGAFGASTAERPSQTRPHWSRGTPGAPIGTLQAV